MSSAVLTSGDVAREVERLAADSGFGYVHVIVANGHIERIDRCVQIKGAAGPLRPVSVETAAHRD